MVERIIKAIVQHVLMQERMIRGKHYNEESIIIRRENCNFNLYVNTDKVAVSTQKVEEIIEKIKKELEKQFEIVDEKTLKGFKIISLNLK